MSEVTANGSVEEILAEVQVILEDMRTDAAKCDVGNKAAGRRVRKDAQELVRMLKNVRVLVLEKSR